MRYFLFFLLLIWSCELSPVGKQDQKYRDFFRSLKSDIKSYYQLPNESGEGLRGYWMVYDKIVYQKPWDDFSYEKDTDRYWKEVYDVLTNEMPTWFFTRDDEGTKSPYWTKGDFNCDQKEDYVYILFNSVSNQYDLVAFVSEGKEFPPIVLGVGLVREMGLATVRPGNHLTASGKGYWQPSPEDPPEITLSCDGIRYFTFESAASILHFDLEKKHFKKTWISD